MSVTLVPVECMYRNKNRNETYVEVRFKTLILESRKYHPKARETIVFFTILYLVIFPKQSSFQLIESVERTVNLLLLLVSNEPDERLSAPFMKSNQVLSWCTGSQRNNHCSFFV